MSKTRSGEHKGAVRTKILAARRRTEIINWLAGKGPRTDEEEVVAKQFSGSNSSLLIQKAIAFHRQTHALNSLTGGNNCEELIDATKRRIDLINYLAGNEDIKLNR